MTRARKFDRHNRGERDAFAVCLFAEWAESPILNVHMGVSDWPSLYSEAAGCIAYTLPEWWDGETDALLTVHYEVISCKTTPNNDGNSVAPSRSHS